MNRPAPVRSALPVSLVALALAAALASCRPPATGPGVSAATAPPGSLEPDRHRLLEGVWLDTETQTKMTIERGRDGFTVASAIDDSGEVYKLSNVKWENGTLSWTYYVPSTQYTVNWQVKKVHRDRLECAWSGTSGEGVEILERVGAPPPIPSAGGKWAALEGVWEDPDTLTRFTVTPDGKGGFGVTAVVDDDGEEYKVTASKWTAGHLTWSYRVPSSGWTVEFRTHKIAEDKIEAAWKGTGGAGMTTLRRVGGAGGMPQELAGMEADWLDTSASILMTVKWQDGAFTVTHAVDISDGEIFPVRNVKWQNNVLSWTTEVPSTSSVINWKTVELRGDELETVWDGTHGDGTEVLERQGPPGGGPKPERRPDSGD